MGTQSLGTTDPHAHFVGPAVGVPLRGRHVPRRARQLHGAVGASQAQRGRNRRARSGAQGPARAHRAPLVHGADVSLGDGRVDVRAAVHGVPADRRRSGSPWVHVALDGGARADRLDHLPHRPRHVLARLLVDLGRSEGHSRVQGRDHARARAATCPGTEAGQVSARQPALSPGDRRRRLRGRDHRPADDAAHPHAALHAQSVHPEPTRRGASPTCCTASPASAWSAWSSRTSTSRSGPTSGGSPRA